MSAILDVNDLCVSFRQGKRRIPLVENVSFRVEKGVVSVFLANPAAEKA